MTAPRSERFDLVVLGSGAAGLSAAVTAAFYGLRAVVLDKDPDRGGTTAWAGGWIGASRNPPATARGIRDDAEAIRGYLRNVLGGITTRRVSTRLSRPRRR